MISRRPFLAATGGLALTAGGGYMLTRGPDHDAATTALWSPRDPSEFAGLVHYATLAANSHNAEAWRFRHTADGVAILPDLSRALPVADSDDHHLFVSLGCAAENLMLAAGAAGRSSTSVLMDDGESRIEVALGTRGTQDPLFAAILERQCTRSDYDGRAVPAADRAALKIAARIEGVE